MKHQLRLAGLAVLLSLSAGHAIAQEKLKIGVIVTLSGPAAALGQQVRDGFTLAVKDLGGKMAAEHETWIADIFSDLAPTDVRELMRLLAKTKASARKSTQARAL